MLAALLTELQQHGRLTYRPPWQGDGKPPPPPHAALAQPPAPHPGPATMHSSSAAATGDSTRSHSGEEATVSLQRTLTMAATASHEDTASVCGEEGLSGGLAEEVTLPLAEGRVPLPPPSVSRMIEGSTTKELPRIRMPRRIGMWWMPYG